MRGPPGGPAPQPRFGGPPGKDSIWPRGANAWGDMGDNSQMGGNSAGIGGGWGDLDGGNKRESSAWPDSGPTGGSSGGWGGNQGGGQNSGWGGGNQMKQEPANNPWGGQQVQKNHVNFEANAQKVRPRASQLTVNRKQLAFIW